MSDFLLRPPKYFRVMPVKDKIESVHQGGGYRKAGLISGVSVITKGEALGHDLWIDDVFLHEVAGAINNASNAGIKSRFTHPSLSGDGLGRFVGRVRDAEIDGDKVIADQHFSESAHITPDGNLAAYLMKLAEEDPTSYGLSIVFDMDTEEMAAFEAMHSDGESFMSPDVDNDRDLPHARLKSLRAIDAVDDPAANPDGLFRRDSEIVEQAEAVAEFSLGLSDEKPKSVALGLDADRVRGFVTRFLSEHNLEIRPMVSDQEIEKADVNDEDAPADDVTDTVVTESKPDTDTPEQSDKGVAPVEIQPVEAKTGEDFLEAFGDQGGVWFAKGYSWDEALALEREALRKENDELKQKLAASSAGEDSPIDFDSADEVVQKGQGLAGKIKVS